MRSPFSFDRARLDAVAAEYGDRYRWAKPFPHVVLDDFVPPAVLDGVLDEFPAPTAEHWFRFDSGLEQKLATQGEDDLGPRTRDLLRAFNDSTMIDFLGELTGIRGLVPDPHFVGGGLHQIEQGGFLEVHADFNRHPLTALERRINLLLYLNRDWDPAWGGALELWDSSMSRCEVRVDPVFNRCVIFSTTDRSFHGHPAPLACPPEVTRRSIAIYYYARDPDPGDGQRDPHNTLFQRRPGVAPEPLPEPTARPSLARRFASAALPPILLRGLRALRSRTLQ